VIKKYGTDDHEATLKMATEIGASERVFFLLDYLGKSEEGTYDAIGSKDWELKILLYSDMRVGPHGVVSSDERTKDLVARYTGTSREEMFRNLSLIVPEIERQISANLSIKTKQINDQTTQAYVKIRSCFRPKADSFF
jgi:hypothetical protein